MGCLRHPFRRFRLRLHLRAFGLVGDRGVVNAKGPTREQRDAQCALAWRAEDRA
jgi:hypothetical protein